MGPGRWRAGRTFVAVPAGRDSPRRCDAAPRVADVTPVVPIDRRAAGWARALDVEGQHHVLTGSSVLLAAGEAALSRNLR